MIQYPKFSKETATHAAKLILRLEWVWIATMILAYWHISPPIRDNYVFLLLFAIPIYLARFIVHQRLFTRTPLDLLLGGFILLTIYNFNNAPLAREDYWVLVCRPLLGILMIWYFVEHARQHGHIRYLIAVTICLTTLIGIVALLSTQWWAVKTEELAFFINMLPELNHKQILPDMQLSFNPNEIAGALAYCCPFLLAISLGNYRTSTDHIPVRFEGLVNWLEKWVAPVGFIITLVALFFGQSRFGLAGTFIGLFIVIILILPDWKKRAIGISGWIFIVLLEISFIFNLLPATEVLDPNNLPTTETTATTPLTQRDESSLLTRLALWDRAIQMTLDYPSTGAGMSVYRAIVTREEYEIPTYARIGSRPPHAHNALLQMGADLGLIGWALFVGWYSVTLWMAYYTLREGNLKFSILTIAIASSILSYMGYGIGDAITLWDRFAFIHWWFIALMSGVYIAGRCKVINDI